MHLSIIHITVIVVFCALSGVCAAPAQNSLIQDSTNSVLNQVAGIASSAVELKSNILTPSEKTRESAKLESEGLPSRILSTYEEKQKKSASWLNVTPVIDSITDNEKLGNDGSQTSGISRALVNTYETFAQVINRIFDKPEEVARAISSRITQQLDVIGGRLVGLAK